MGIFSGKADSIASWGRKEALVGDRLPYLRLLDDNIVLLRDGSVMLSLLVPGLSFETADSDELNAHAATRSLAWTAAQYAPARLSRAARSASGEGMVAQPPNAASMAGATRRASSRRRFTKGVMLISTPD